LLSAVFFFSGAFFLERESLIGEVSIGSAAAFFFGAAALLAFVFGGATGSGCFWERVIDLLLEGRSCRFCAGYFGI
jgi:hypothetical protein